MISLVDLGVIKSVSIDGSRVHVALTPTFMGCPALDAMRQALAERIEGLGAEPQIEVVLDDSWSTDRITASGRAKLRGVRLRAARTPLCRPDHAPAARRRARSAVPGAARPTRGSRTSSARRRAARCATATPAASRSSISRRSMLEPAAALEIDQHRNDRRELDSEAERDERPPVVDVRHFEAEVLAEEAGQPA